jgi:sialidase-1
MVESRRTSCSDQAPKDVEMSRSYDGGRSWERPRVVFGDLVGNTTYRNPYLTVVTNSAGQEAIVLQFVNSTVAEPWITFQMTSTDAGNTWSNARAVSCMYSKCSSLRDLSWCRYID